MLVLLLLWLLWLLLWLWLLWLSLLLVARLLRAGAHPDRTPCLWPVAFVRLSPAASMCYSDAACKGRHSDDGTHEHADDGGRPAAQLPSATISMPPRMRTAERRTRRTLVSTYSYRRAAASAGAHPLSTTG